jgi:hypothetical protein
VCFEVEGVSCLKEGPSFLIVRRACCGSKELEDVKKAVFLLKNDG